MKLQFLGVDPGFLRWVMGQPVIWLLLLPESQHETGRKLGQKKGVGCPCASSDSAMSSLQIQEISQDRERESEWIIRMSPYSLSWHRNIQFWMMDANLKICGQWCALLFGNINFSSSGGIIWKRCVMFSDFIFWWKSYVKLLTVEGFRK